MTLHSFLIAVAAAAIFIFACGLLMLHWRQDDLRHQHSSGDHKWGPSFPAGTQRRPAPAHPASVSAYFPDLHGPARTEAADRPARAVQTLPGPAPLPGGHQVPRAGEPYLPGRGDGERAGTGDAPVPHPAGQHRAAVNAATPLWQGPNQRSHCWPMTGRIVSDTAYNRANSAGLNALLEIDAARARANHGFAGIAYQARHALALPAGATA